MDGGFFLQEENLSLLHIDGKMTVSLSYRIALQWGVLGLVERQKEEDTPLASTTVKAEMD